MVRSVRRRPKTRQETWEGTAWLTVFTGLIFGYQAVFSRSGWTRLLAIAVAFASTAVLMFITAFVRAMIRDTWPRGVPPELTEKYMALKAAGWQLPRVHRWWKCGEARLHTHLFMPGAPPEGRELVLIWGGTAVLDVQGNVVRHEP